MQPTDWTYSDTDDLAVVDVTDELCFDQEKFIWNDDIGFVSENDLIQYDDGSSRAAIGDQTIMLGLFADHGGGAGGLNVPVARFGNVAALPDPGAPVSLYATDGFVRPAFLNDMRSRSGFSGSPVWAWYTPYADVDVSLLGGTWLEEPRKATSLSLIGVHRGQFREHVSVTSPSTSSGLKIGDSIDVASSMTVVIPAWEIKSLLDKQKFEDQRSARDRRPDRIAAGTA